MVVIMTAILLNSCRSHHKKTQSNLNFGKLQYKTKQGTFFGSSFRSDSHKLKMKISSINKMCKQQISRTFGVTQVWSITYLSTTLDWQNLMTA